MSEYECNGKRWLTMGYCFLLWGFMDRPVMCIVGGLAISIGYLMIDSEA